MFDKKLKGGIYKPRSVWEGVAEMSILLNNSYEEKIISTKWDGVKNIPKFCPHGLYAPPKATVSGSDHMF